jgi:hypothetical protein
MCLEVRALSTRNDHWIIGKDSAIRADPEKASVVEKWNSPHSEGVALQSDRRPQ